MNEDQAITLHAGEQAAFDEAERLLEELATQLAEKEFALTELTLALRRFEHAYNETVGHKYVRLDELRAWIATLLASRTPEEPEVRQRAEEAREQAQQSSEDYERIRMEPQPRAVSADEAEDIRGLYLKLAKRIHPDKAEDESTIPLRTRLMAALNEAREQNDLERMRRIAAEWEASPESADGQPGEGRLQRIERAIAHARTRLDELDQTMAAITGSELYSLHTRVQEAAQEGRDLLAEMAAQVDKDIAAAQAELERLRS